MFDFVNERDLEGGNVVYKGKFQNATVYICDTYYKDKTKEEMLRSVQGPRYKIFLPEQIEEALMIKIKLEEKIGRITDEEFNYAIEQFERNEQVTGKKIYDDTAYDILAANVDCFRRRENQAKNGIAGKYSEKIKK